MSRDEHYIFNPNDTFVKDYEWISSRPAGETHTCIIPKTASYKGAIEVAVGAGRNGKNALKMTAVGREETGDPAWWIIPLTSTGGAWVNPAGDDNFVVPPGKRANRIEIWVRFPPGYRKIGTPLEPLYTPNFVWGTYCTDPAGAYYGINDGGLLMREETYGWHFYHMPKTRFDWLEDNEWVRIVVNAAPAHVRGGAGVLGARPNHPTTPYSENYFAAMTRSYFEWGPYWWRWDGGQVGAADQPEVPVPYSIYCDSIRFYWVDEYKPVAIRFGPQGDYLDGQAIEIPTYPTVTDIPFRVTNITDASVSGRLGYRGLYGAPRIVPQAGGSPFHWSSITLAAGETRHFWLRISPVENADPVYAYDTGLIFEPSTEYVESPVGYTTSHGPFVLNKTSNRLVNSSETSAFGGADYDLCSRNIRWQPNSGGNVSYQPTSRGGVTYRVPPTVTSQFYLPGRIPDGSTLTFAKGNSEAGRGTLTIASSGLVTYTPPSAGWEGTCHFSYRINGDSAKPSIWYGAWVDVTPKRQIAMVSGGNILTGPGGGIITVGSV